MRRHVFTYPLCLLLAAVATTASPRPARADYKQAASYYSQGDYNRAIQELKPDLDKSPNWEFGHRLLGLCYLGVNNNALAVSSLSRAAELKSTAFSTYYGLGQAYFNMQRYSDAIASLNRAEPLAAKEGNPGAERARIQLIRGAAYYRSRRYADAVEDLQGAVRANASDWTLHSMLGISYFNLNRTDEAIPALERALALKPGEANAKDVLGKAYLKKGAQALSGKQYAAAVQALTKAKSYDPDNGYVDYNLAEAHLFQKQYPAAEKALLQASSRLPDNAGVFTRLGLVYEKQNKRDQALKAYKKAYELNPSPELKEAVDRFATKK
ncbi:MAG: tetratricopeptide repeat protein [Acidobacteriota bacterium]|jgi:tetratricopeptide (TPR) repeat protein|nr:tetratricopeptide repeat protein [Acidobacteriota bacterium]